MAFKRAYIRVGRAAFLGQQGVSASGIAVTSVSLDKPNVWGFNGQTTQLTATVLPVDATDKSVTWGSDDEAVATVSSSGLVTIVDASGTAIITVTTVSGGKTDTSNVVQTDYSGEGRTSAQIDTLLGELNAIGLSSTVLDITGNDLRTSASDADYAALLAAGVVIDADPATSAAFKTTWDTTKAGSPNDTVIVPLSEAYDFEYNFNIKTSEHNFDVVGFGPVVGNQTLQFAAPGIYQIEITELAVGGFPRIFFNAVGDRLKVVSLDNCGTGRWKDMAQSFTGCNNMVANFSDMFDTQDVISVKNMLNACYLFNADMTSMNTSSVTDFSGMHRTNSACKQSLAYDITSATNLGLIALSTDINDTGTTTNLDATLASMRAQAVAGNITGLTPHYGSAQYSAAGEVDKNILENATYNWTISSGGLKL